MFVVCFNFILLPSLNYNAAQIWRVWYLYSFIAIFTLSVNPAHPPLCFCPSPSHQKSHHRSASIFNFNCKISYQEPHYTGRFVNICNVQSSPHYLSAVEKIGKISSDFYVGQNKVAASEDAQAFRCTSWFH